MTSNFLFSQEAVTLATELLNQVHYNVVDIFWQTEVPSVASLR